MYPKIKDYERENDHLIITYENGVTEDFRIFHSSGTLSTIQNTQGNIISFLKEYSGIRTYPDGKTEQGFFDAEYRQLKTTN